MKRPINFFLEKFSSLGELRCKEEVKFWIPFAESQAFFSEDAKIVLQKYRSYLYFMEMIEFDVSNHSEFNYEVLYPTLFMFFMLDGKTELSNDNGELLNRALYGSFYITFNQSGIYNARFEKGKNVILYIAFRLDWILAEEECFPKISNFLKFSLKSSELVTYMEKLYMSRSLLKLLVRILHIDYIKSKDIETELYPLIKDILKGYDKAQNYRLHLLHMSNRERIFEIRGYLVTNFLKPMITDLRSLCEKFYISERTLRRVFYQMESRSISNFVMEHRLEYARKTLLNNKISIKALSTQCGFSSSNYFCRMFKKKYGIAPEKFRSLAL